MQPLARRSIDLPGSVPQTALGAPLGARRMTKPRDEGQRTAGAEKGGQQQKTLPSNPTLAKPNLLHCSTLLLPASLPCQLSRQVTVLHSKKQDDPQKTEQRRKGQLNPSTFEFHKMHRI